MKRILNIAKNIILSLILTIGTSFSTHSFKNQNKARVFFMYERSFFGNDVQISINDNQIFMLPTNKYFFMDVEPSNIIITINKDDSSAQPIQANLSLEPNQVYYLKIYREIDYFTNKLYLVRIGEQTAKKAMKAMKLESSASTILKNE